MIRALISKLLKRWSLIFSPADRLSYWENRSRQLGPLAVLDKRHKEIEIEAVTEYQINQILPHLKKKLKPDIHMILDFGCGTGRFTPYLKNLSDGRVIGVDPIQYLLDMAPAAEGIEYRLMTSLERVPVPSNSIDLIWICLVLGGIRDSALPAIVEELVRVGRNEAVICLVENTSKKPNAKHWTFRSNEFYMKLFPFSKLVPVNTYHDFDEEITVFIGSLNKISS